jgi:hypothetical protein
MERHYKQERLLNDWLASNVFNIPSAHIRLDLAFTSHYTDKQADGEKTFALFRNHINQHFYGNRARMFGPDFGLKMTASFHREPLRLKKNQQPHIHILCEVPPGKTVEDLEWFLREKFVKKHKYVSSDFYIEDTRNTQAAIKYNNRNGYDTILGF